MRSHELHRDAAERTEIGVQRIALARKYHARKRAGEHQMTGVQRNAVLPQLVGKPSDAERRMPEHAGSDAGLFDFGIALHDAADPAQVEIERTDRPPADHNAGGGAVI